TVDSPWKAGTRTGDSQERILRAEGREGFPDGLVRIEPCGFHLFDGGKQVFPASQDTSSVWRPGDPLVGVGEQILIGEFFAVFSVVTGVRSHDLGKVIVHGRTALHIMPSCHRSSRATHVTRPCLHYHLNLPAA